MWFRRSTYDWAITWYLVAGIRFQWLEISGFSIFIWAKTVPTTDLLLDCSWGQGVPACGYECEAYGSGFRAQKKGGAFFLSADWILAQDLFPGGWEWQRSSMGNGAAGRVMLWRGANLSVRPGSTPAHCAPWSSTCTTSPLWASFSLLAKWNLQGFPHRAAGSLLKIIYTWSWHRAWHSE